MNLHRLWRARPDGTMGPALRFYCMDGQDKCRQSVHIVSISGTDSGTQGSGSLQRHIFAGNDHASDTQAGPG